MNRHRCQCPFLLPFRAKKSGSHMPTFRRCAKLPPLEITFNMLCRAQVCTSKGQSHPLEASAIALCLWLSDLFCRRCTLPSIIVVYSTNCEKSSNNDKCQSRKAVHRCVQRKKQRLNTGVYIRQIGLSRQIFKLRTFVEFEVTSYLT